MYFGSGHQKHTVLVFFSTGKYQGASFTMMAMDAYSYKRHSKSSSEELYHEWKIDLEKSKATLDITTQMNVMLIIFPMTKR